MFWSAAVITALALYAIGVGAAFEDAAAFGALVQAVFGASGLGVAGELGALAALCVKAALRCGAYAVALAVTGQRRCCLRVLASD